MNFQILIKIAALIQDINLSSSETNHFFGDLFEGLLSKNVHQTEGQFFTPLPIVNFIIKPLTLYGGFAIMQSKLSLSNETYFASVVLI